jgi:drug/metabolite transporter (DMT)-like permease
VLGVGLGLLSSVAWGISDFLGGLQTRRRSALVVLLVSQPVGLVLALAVALSVGGDALAPREALIAIAAGATAVFALGAFYRAMALGSISVVATIGALGVIVPVVAGLARGEEPGALQTLGAAVAIGGAAAVAWEPDPEWRAASLASIGLAAVAALGFGVFFLGLDLASPANPAWTIVAARAGGVGSLLLAAAYVRPSLRLDRRVLPVLAVIGLFDILANTLYALATNHGILPLISVAASLYAAVTVLLARVFLGERLAGSQRAGLAATLAGVGLIGVGG